MATAARIAPKDEASLRDDLGQEFSLQFKEVGLDRHEKGRISLPDNMSLSEAIYWLRQKQADEETMVAVNERIDGYPIDVAYCLQLAVMEMFGFRELRSTPNLWEPDTPPTFATVPIDHKTGVVEVFIGRFVVPGCDGYLETHPVANDALVVQGKLRQKNLPILRQLLLATKKTLLEQSLYKGKAFRVSTETRFTFFGRSETMASPEFIDITKAPAKLALNRETEELLRHFNMPLKRGILLYGHYGTGKSLTAHETAQLCTEHGWTFIYVKDVTELREMYKFAARYSPAVLFAEDIDLVMKHEDDDDDEDPVNELNNVLDGVDSKDKEIIVVLTTNFIEKIPVSLLRPGRFDAIIEYFPPNRETAAALVEQYAGDEIDRDNWDAEEVGRVLEGNIPATIHEVVKRAKLFSIGRYPKSYKKNLLLSTSDIVNSMNSMNEHLRLLNKKPATEPSFTEVLGGAVGKAIARELPIAFDHAQRGSESRYDTEAASRRVLAPMENGQNG